ncbi:transmembrane protein [Citrus sinensis]|uniref:Transmembrane protein n=1 Tax=Citrus sinensis TaxID=2711 RepID=A0ACB8JYZ6_CITSI|nr:transmembrane protein [Citrus sinensis]
MGTREVYEEKLRSGNLHHDPTMKPGLGCPRCPRCLSLLDPNSEKGEWTITSVLHDATAVAGSGFGAMLGAVYGFNTGIPFLQNHLKGPKWLPFVTGIPLLLMFSGASAAFGDFHSKSAERRVAGRMRATGGWDGVDKVVMSFGGRIIGYALPKFTQLSVTSYYAASSASHYGISLLTRKIEEGHNSGTWQEKLR